MSKVSTIVNPLSDIIMYNKPDGTVNVEILVQNETLWMQQSRIAELFDVDRTVITKHLRNIFNEGELDETSVCAKIAHTASDGKTYNTKFYNLDAILSIGYRVNSKQATMFRIFASQVLKEYLIKGFAMDDNRLKNPNNIFGKDYFDEQLERIRDIRSSERRFYQKITDIYSQCSADYDVNANETKTFFATVQNKLHYATTQHTAAEIVTMYLDYAERQANRGIIMNMKDWADRLDAFLQFNEEEVLQDKGKVTHAIAKTFAEEEFEKYSQIRERKYVSDFDRLILEVHD